MEKTKDEKFAHIRKFEKNLEFQLEVLDNLENTLKLLKKSLVEYEKLIEYYYSEQRNKDLEADQRGEIPSNLKRAVLSEDEIYNMMIGYQENAIEMLEIATAMLKA